MKDIVGDYRERFRLQRKALRRYTALLLALAMITTLFVNWQLHSDGIAATAQYQCNQEEHTHTADCYTKVLVCGYEEGQPEDWNATFDDSASLDESIGVDAEDDGIALFSAEPEYIYVPHEHTDDCYQEVKTLTCLEEEHVHGDDCFDPEDGSLICEQFEHVHDDSCYTTDYELVCGLEDGELVEELNPAYTAVAAFEAPVAAKPVVVSPVIEAPIHYHTDDCYEEVLTCGLEEHHHTVNCLADPLADVEDESEWLAKTNTSLSGDWSADLLTVAQSQLGYEQSEKNFELDADDGVTVRHYTRYGEWYGNPYGEWDVMFLSYCLNYAGIPQSAIPQRAGVLALRSDLRGAGYLMDPQSIPAAQQDAIALCDEGLPEEESFADADADDLGFADSASSFCSIQPGDIVFYNTTVTETVTAENEPQIETLSLENDADADTGDTALSSLSTPADPPRTEQRTTVSETLGIVSDVDEAADTLTVISGNVDGKVDSVQVNISQLTGLISLAAVQEKEGFRAAAPTEDVSGLDGKDHVTNNVENAKNPDYVPHDSLKVSNLWQNFSGNTITDDAQLSTFGAVTVTLTKHSKKATVTFVGTDGASYSYRVSRGAVITVSGHWSDGSHTIAAETSGNAALSYSTDGTVLIKDIAGDVTVQVNTSISGGFADNVSVADGYADGVADGEADGNADGESFTRDLGSIQLNSGNHWTHTWTGLESSADVWYTVEEVAMEGYKTSYTVNGAAVQEGSTPSIILSAAEGSHVQIVNQSTQGSYELPSTGGAGTTLYTAVGGAMVLAALVCGFCQKRRRERRAD